MIIKTGAPEGFKRQKIALPRIKSFMERRVMTRIPGPVEQWAGRLETENGGEYLVETGIKVLTRYILY